MELTKNGVLISKIHINAAKDQYVNLSTFRKIKDLKKKGFKYINLSEFTKNGQQCTQLYFCGINEEIDNFLIENQLEFISTITNQIENLKISSKEKKSEINQQLP